MEVAMPRWIGINLVITDLFLTGGNVNPQITVEVNADKVTKVTFIGELRKKVNGTWIAVESWNVSKNVSTKTVVFNETYRAEKGCEYTYVTTVRAYSGTTLLDTIDVKGPTV